MILCFSGFPDSTQYWRASLRAASTASEPLERKYSLSRSPGGASHPAPPPSGRSLGEISFPLPMSRPALRLFAPPWWGPAPLPPKPAATPPGENLVTDATPPIPAGIAEVARRYGEFRAAAF